MVGLARVVTQQPVPTSHQQVVQNVVEMGNVLHLMCVLARKDFKVQHAKLELLNVALLLAAVKTQNNVTVAASTHKVIRENVPIQDTNAKAVTVVSKMEAVRRDVVVKVIVRKVANTKRRRKRRR